MKVEVIRNDFYGSIYLTPENPKEVSDLIYIALNHKKGEPEIFSYSINGCQLLIENKLIDRNKRILSVEKPSS